MPALSLYTHPIHLGRYGSAVAEPEFTGPEWYEAYTARHAEEMDEARIVSLFRFETSWDSWEMHPAGDEVVACIEGEMVLHQELPDGTTRKLALGPGDYAINPAGTWHTADCERPVTGLFITAGKDTTHRPRG